MLLENEEWFPAVGKLSIAFVLIHHKELLHKDCVRVNEDEANDGE